MTATVRLSLAARAFFIATVLGLSLIFGDPRVFQALALLVLVAALATAADHVLVGNYTLDRHDRGRAGRSHHRHHACPRAPS